jgi:hypothetical protein
MYTTIQEKVSCTRTSEARRMGYDPLKGKKNARSIHYEPKCRALHF